MDWKKLLNKLLYPPVWLIVLLTVLSAAALTVVFVKGWSQHPLAAAAYVLSAYTVTVLTVACIRVFPGYVRDAKQKVYAYPLGHRLMTDAAFKTHVSLYCSLTLNLLYVAFNLVSGFFYRSAWFIVMAAYYTILALMRFLLVRYVKHNELGEQRLSEWKRSRVCAVILLTINVALSGAVLMIMYQNRGFEYHGILIYIVAMYTFYITTTAIVDIVKYRKYNSPVMSMTKVIKLAAALVSMLSLETAMLTEFGKENSAQFRRVMIASTGAGVSVVIVALSAYMIVRAGKEIKAHKKGAR